MKSELPKKELSFKDVRILITGHTGFIGTWLTSILVKMGANVCGFSLDPPTTPNIYNAVNLKESISDVRGNVLDKISLQNTLREFQPELVFHLAAQPIVSESYNSPLNTFEVNVNGTVNLLESIRQIDCVKTIIVMTSDKSYKNNEWIYPYRETDSLGGRDPYSASKSCQDIVSNSYRESFFSEIGVGLSVIRAGNIIGGGDWSRNRIIPDLVRGIINKEITHIRNPASKRPWQYVLDPLFAMIKLSNNMKLNKSFWRDWNLGPLTSQDVSVNEIARKFVKEWGSGEYTITPDSDQREHKLLKLDTSLAKTLLNWEPKYSLETAVRDTVRWYKTYYFEPQKLIELTNSMINEYFQKQKSFLASS